MKNRIAIPIKYYKNGKAIKIDDGEDGYGILAMKKFKKEETNTDLPFTIGLHITFNYNLYQGVSIL